MLYSTRESPIHQSASVLLDRVNNSLINIHSTPNPSLETHQECTEAEFMNVQFRRANRSMSQPLWYPIRPLRHTRHDIISMIGDDSYCTEGLRVKL